MPLPCFINKILRSFSALKNSSVLPPNKNHSKAIERDLLQVAYNPRGVKASVLMINTKILV